MDKDPYIIAFLKRSKCRRCVLNCLRDGPKTQAEIVRATGMYRSHVTRTIREVEKRQLVDCLNPKDHQGRLYQLHPKRFFTGSRLLLIIGTIMEIMPLMS